MNEDKASNDLFFLCSLIEYIARQCHQPKAVVVERLGRERLARVYRLADVYHSQDIAQTCDELVAAAGLERGDYDVLAMTHNPRPPSFWDMGRVYQRLVVAVAAGEAEYLDQLEAVLTSWLIPHLDNYDSSLYYESPGYLLACYQAGEILP